jgi:redox-sensitive bicupin YhaK (pirin superfamily)
VSNDTVFEIMRLGAPPWTTFDPFLFCVHHLDHYPEGNETMGPKASLAGRRIGMDFEGIDGWRMYHGDEVPGFPRHPHRGFETVTLARQGYIDHSDSLGATARFGHGDCQWMTAGAGVVHSEMFPLVNRDAANPTELFQIWLNLPRKDKMVEPYFTMLWADTIPEHTFRDDAGHETKVSMIAGALGERPAPPPPPNSWASRDEADVAIWIIQLGAGAEWTLPAAKSADANRTLYCFEGGTVTIEGREVPLGHAARLKPDREATIRCGDVPTQLLMLQGRPIGEPVVQYGPFVMNAPGEIKQTILDYQRTGFGGWPWDRDDPVHARDRKRFAIHADGREEAAE